MTTDVNDFLMGGGAVSAKFDQKGTMIQGEIVSSEVRQQTEYKTKEPMVWKDGSPRMQLVVTVQTAEFEDAEDDGRRRVFVKGAMAAAVRSAVLEAGERGIANGGKLAVKYTGDGIAEGGMNPPKQYQVWYQPPVHQQTGEGDENPFNDDAPHPAEAYESSDADHPF